MTQQKPIFVATHPRACSTAFERVFMTQRDSLQCIHEPFGDAFYFGPERLSSRYQQDEQAREESGFGESTYKTILDRIEKEGDESHKRLFIKDIIHYLFPPDAQPASIAPSLSTKKKGVGTEGSNDVEVHRNGNGAHDGNGDRNGNNAQRDLPYPYGTQAEPGNPTVIPEAILKKFHFTFLIRHPSRSIPSYYRCTIPPLDKVTGFYDFKPSEAGYLEVRRMFDFLKSVGQVGPKVATHPEQHVQSGMNGITKAGEDHVDICVVDADDLLDHPAEVIEKFCASVGIEYTPEMLKWSDDDQKSAADAFEKWKGFHEDAIHSCELKARTHRAQPTTEQQDAEWTKKYGAEAAKVIRDTVDANVEDYQYLKQFAIKVGCA